MCPSRGPGPSRLAAPRSRGLLLSPALVKMAQGKVAFSSQQENVREKGVQLLSLLFASSEQNLLTWLL